MNSSADRPARPGLSLFMVEILVDDRAASARWYVDVLGLRTILDDPGGKFLLLEAGEGRVALKERPGPRDPRGSVRLVFRVDDLDELAGRLAGLGVAVGPIMESPEGYREARLVDPDGTPIHLFDRAPGGP